MFVLILIDSVLLSSVDEPPPMAEQSVTMVHKNWVTSSTNPMVAISGLFQTVQSYFSKKEEGSGSSGVVSAFEQAKISRPKRSNWTFFF